MSKEQCGNCRFLMQSGEPTLRGLCCRNAPIVDSYQTLGVHPLVSIDWWCGEWRAPYCSECNSLAQPGCDAHFDYCSQYKAIP